MKRNRIKSAAPLVLYLLCAGLCLWLASCTTTRTVEHRITVRDTVKSRQTDTLLLLKNTRDSVFLQDTVWKTRGVLIETARHETTDKKEKEKEKEGTNWFSVFMVVVTGIGLVNFVRKR